MKKLNKFIFVIIFVVACLFISSTFVSAAALDVRSRLTTGSEGKQVELLQEELNAVMDSGLTVDGKFGSKTKAAVQKFQTQYGLTSDGIAGPRTAGKLNVAYLAKNNYIVIYVDPTINNGQLNVRSEASASSTKLGTIPSGSVRSNLGTTVAANGTTWYKINYNGKTAYISGSYVNDTCILLDLSDQILKVFINGKFQLHAPVITGNNGNNGTVSHKTPTGKYLFYKSNKKTNVVLRGPNDDGSRYESPVTYWMPFITSRGIGFHDASWRPISHFYNKNTYLTNGSHGCVNMISGDAKDLYNLITSNIYVYVVQ